MGNLNFFRGCHVVSVGINQLEERAKAYLAIASLLTK